MADATLYQTCNPDAGQDTWTLVADDARWIDGRPVAELIAELNQEWLWSVDGAQVPWMGTRFRVARHTCAAPRRPQQPPQRGNRFDAFNESRRSNHLRGY